MLDPATDYGAHWHERRDADRDRQDAKADRTASRNDRNALAGSDVDDGPDSDTDPV
jgi:hypothetical protein